MVIALLKRLTEYVEYVQSYVLKLQFCCIFISNFEHIKHISVMFFLLNLNKFSRLTERTNWLILFLNVVLFLPVLDLLIRYGYNFKLSHFFWTTLHKCKQISFAIRFATLFEETYIATIMSTNNLSVKASFGLYFAS